MRLLLAFAVLGCGRDQRTPKAPGADCALVAETLTSFELGNYASLEERAPKVDAWRARCEAEELTKVEGQCVIDARTTDELRMCGKPLMFAPYVPTKEGEPIAGLPPACSDYLVTLEKYARCRGLPPETRQSIATTVATMRKNWSGLSGPMPQAVTDACVQGHDAVAQAMVSFNCF